jgi:small subunit ribosomal protein S15
LAMVARRRKLLDYTRGKSEERYQKLIKALGIRK